MDTFMYYCDWDLPKASR